MINKNYSITVIAVMIWMVIHNHQVYADLTKQYIIEAPLHINHIIKSNHNNLPICITAKNVTAKYPYFIEYTGNVYIQQDDKVIITDKAKLTKKEIKNQNPVYEILAIGNIYYNDSQILIKGIKGRLNLNNRDVDIEKGDYLIVDYSSRGYADKIKLRKKNRYIIIKKGMFTNCLPNNNSWNILGSKVILDRKKEIVKIWNARFCIANTPIFYIPYIQLPVGNKKRSGFLSPSSNYSNSSGFNIAFPFYWNISPNYNITITPQIITFRGLKLNSEFRYSTVTKVGTINIDWLKHDRMYAKDIGNSNCQINNNRWLLYCNYFETLNSKWCFNIDYTRVSDSQYLTNFSAKNGNSSDWYITQKFIIDYIQSNWNTTLTYKKFQIFINSPNNKIYKIEPKLEFNYYKDDYKLFKFKTYAQAVRITNAKVTGNNVIRLHVEPEINLPLSNNWINTNNRIKLMATHYNQNISDNLDNKNIKKRITRILPSLTSDINFIIERNLSKNKNYIQTLEPKIQYLYIPYKNQNNINNYDSSLLQANYNGLFRARTYSGIDRIASANQLAVGIDTNIYNKNLIKKFNFSVGQIYYFKYPRTQNLDSITKIKNDTGSLLWASRIYILFTDNWKLHGELQYNRHLTNITTGNIVTEYRQNSNCLVQVNYRFINHSYIQITSKNTTALNKDISQIGAIVNWSLNDHWMLISSYYHNLKINQPITKLINLQYSSCCWSIAIGYERKIIKCQQQNFNSIYDNKWSIDIELGNINHNFNLRNQDMFTGNILPYQ